MNNVSFSPDGAKIAAINVDGDGAAIVWDVYSGSESFRVPLVPTGRDNKCGRVQWSPDGRFLAYNPEIWNAVTGQASSPSEDDSRISKLITSRWNSHKVAFTTDSSLLATADSFQGIRIFDTVSGEIKNTFSTNPLWATCVAFSPDNRFIAAGSGSAGRSRSGAVKIRDVATGADGIALEESFYLAVWDLAYSPDGTRLAAAIGDYRMLPNSVMSGEVVTGKGAPGEVVVWNVQTGVSLHRLPHRSCVWAVSFSPDGQRLASASGNRIREPADVKIWDLFSGQEVCSCTGHTREVFGVAFSPCGRRLATSSRDGTIKFWDGTPLAEIPSRFEPQQDMGLSSTDTKRGARIADLPGASIATSLQLSVRALDWGR